MSKYERDKKTTNWDEDGAGNPGAGYPGAGYRKSHITNKKKKEEEKEVDEK